MVYVVVICLSICLSRVGVLPNQQNKILAKFRWVHPQLGCQMQVGYVKISDFKPVSCYISETMQDGDIVTMES